MPQTVNESDEIISQCRENPLFFTKEVLGVELWDKQEEVLLSTFHNKKTSVRSGHDVGKSFVAAVIALTFLFTLEDSKVITTATTWSQVKRILWSEIQRIYNRSRMALGGVLLNTQLTIEPGWEAIGLSTKNPDSFQGGHAKHILVIKDEAQGVERPIWTATDSMMASYGARELNIGNPTETSGPFYESFQNPKLYNCVHISCYDHPNVKTGDLIYPSAVTREWCEEKKDLWGERSPLYQTRVLGEFSEEGSSAIVSLKILEDAINNEDYNIKEVRHMGIDLARMGSDFNACCVLENREVIALEKWSGLDTMENVAKIIQLKNKYKIDNRNIHLDILNFGAGTYDRLREKKILVEGVNFSEVAKNDWEDIVGRDLKFLNRRAELYWAGAQLLRQKKAKIDRRFGEIWADLSATHSKPDSDDKLRIEPKELIRKRLGHSPDCGDAFIYALSRTPAPRITLI